MKIVGLHDLPLQEETCLTIGGFDGIHRGHQVLIEELINCSNRKGMASVLVTFRIPPQVILKGWELGVLTPPPEKLSILQGYDLDYVLVLEFDAELREMSAESFVQDIALAGLKARQWVLGYNHHFGKNREGNALFLLKNIKRWPFYVAVVPPVLWRGEKVTSSKIREECLRGNVRNAAQLLGRPYLLTGKVVQGSRRGEMTGFPTANIEVDPMKLVPKKGVYACLVEIKGNRHRGIMNIGTRPTFGEGKVVKEVHLLDFQGDLYGDEIRVELIDFIREERKFDSIKKLKDQIEDDISKAKEILEGLKAIP